MKTLQYITALLVAVTFGTSNLNAQTATRNDPRQNREVTVVKKAPERASTAERVRTEQPAKQAAQPQVAKRVPEKQPARQVAQPQVVRRAPEQLASRQQVERLNTSRTPVSISTPKNYRSDYRSPESKTFVKENKFSKERYYSGNHYHNVYPTTHMKVNHHHDTYLHHYNVLYYPTYREIYWNNAMYNDYCRWYPNYHWRYNYGYRIQTVSVFDAKYNLGEVAMVYGRVYATWYNRETDDYLLFFGGDYPQQQFTLVLPGRIARSFSWRPEQYFLGEHLTMTGLITTFDGIPEIIVKNKRQVGIY
jgi:hypothetical protein